MLEKLRIILLLGTCIWTFADSATTFSYNPLTRVVTEEGAQCTKEGLMCDSCVHVSECISIGCNTFIREPVTTCIDSYCNIATGNCSTIPNPQCDPDIVNYVHRCLQIGLFPHPYNRCLYLMCPPGDDGTVLPEARVLRCGDGYAFDPYTTLCRVKLPDDTCPMLIQPCAFPTQRGAIPHNPHMFYICLTNHQSHAMPQMFVCPRSQVYNETKRACEEVVQDTGLNAAGKCQGRGLFYDPTSCFSYNECNDIIDSAPIKRTCASKMYFNEKLAKCVDFTCAQLSQL